MWIYTSKPPYAFKACKGKTSPYLESVISPHILSFENHTLLSYFTASSDNFSPNISGQPIGPILRQPIGSILRVQESRSLRMGPERLSQNISEKLPLLTQKITVLSYCMEKPEILFFSSSSLALQPFKLALVSLIKDAHSVLSNALALHYFTPTSLKSNSTSSIHLNLGLLLFFPLLFCLPLTSLLSSHHLFLQHA